MSWASDQVERYRELEPLYYVFADRLHDLLEQLVVDDGLYLRHSYEWARSPSGFETALYRALREGRRPGERLEEVGDVAGVVLVVSTPAEVDAVAALVERELAIDYGHSLPPAAARAANERNFASEAPLPRYEHAMYLASLDDVRRQLREWSAYADLQLEVHVLTYGQYAWWTTDLHYLPFYWPSSFPPASREAFVRVASLEQELLWLLRRFEIATVAGLHAFLNEASPRAGEIFRRVTELSSERGYVPYAASESLLTFLLLVLNRADPETIELVEYRSEIEAALNILIGNPVASEPE